MADFGGNPHLSSMQRFFCSLEIEAFQGEVNLQVQQSTADLHSSDRWPILLWGFELPPPAVHKPTAAPYSSAQSKGWQSVWANKGHISPLLLWRSMGDPH